MARRYTGTVTSFYHDRGWGFVRVDGLARGDAIIHVLEFPQSVDVSDLARGVRVEFYLEQHAKGLRSVRANII